MSWQKVKSTFLRTNIGVLKESSWIEKIPYIIIYLILSASFTIHLYFVVCEHLSRKFVDVTKYHNLEDYAPDVAICTVRKSVAHKLDLMANFYGNQRLDRCYGSKVGTLTLEYIMQSSLRNEFIHHHQKQNILEYELSSMKEFEDIIVRCQARGYNCSKEDFLVFPRYIRRLNICLIFKSKAFFRKVRQNKVPRSSSTSNRFFLDILLKVNWYIRDQKWKADPMLSEYPESTQKPPLHVFLLQSGAAFLTSDAETSLIEERTLSEGKWRDIEFRLAVTNRTGEQCHSSLENVEILDDVNKTVHSLPLTPNLCHMMAMQKSVKNKCGCYSIMYPVTKSMANASFCQVVPPIFRRATYLRSNCSARVVELLDAENSVITVEPFDAKFFKDTVCSFWSRGISYANVTCYKPCHVVKAKVTKSSYTGVDRKTVDEEFSNVTETDGIDEDSLKQLSVLRIQPSSWMVPVTTMEEVYPLSKVLSDMGGMLGMWLGASMIGLIKFMIRFRKNYITKKTEVSIDLYEKKN